MSEAIQNVGDIVVTRRCVLGKNDDITFQLGVDITRDAAHLNTALDLINAAAERQRAIVELPEREKALEISLKAPATMEREIRRLVEELAKAKAGFEDAYRRSGRRGEYRVTEQEKNALKQYEDQIANCQTNIKRMQQDVPLNRWEVERCKAVIAGEPIPPKPIEEALELVRDVFSQKAA